MSKLTQNDIKKLKYTKEGTANQQTGKVMFPKQIIWDTSPIGFGVRIFPSGRKSFIYKYRNAQGQQRLSDIGAVGDISLEQARQTALEWSTAVHNGEDPLEDKSKARGGALMNALCAAYIERYAKQHKKSWKEDERRINLYISPALGIRQVQHIRRPDIANLHGEIGATKPYMANRVREQLSKMFELAKTWGYVDEQFINPARGIDDFPEEQRSEYIKPEHFSIVAKAIENEPNEKAQCAIWMYFLTGKRRNEILEARWDDIDETARTLKIAPGGNNMAGNGRTRRGSTKNNEIEYVPLNDEAWAILERAKGFRILGNPYIFPSDKKKGGHYVNVRKPWTRIQAEAAKNGAEGIEKVPIHGLRHTVAVWLTNLTDADLGLVRKLLNHKSLHATKVYAKYKQDTVKKALEKHGALVTSLSEPSKVLPLASSNTGS